jgi:glycosyltransferase involved in cell wall biosynthesis
LNNGIIKYPLVSVVIPCFNGEKYIAKTINSVLHQHYPEIEMIIVNDGSKDSTYEILKSYENTTIRIINKPNTGVSDSRNIGMGYASGAYILFLDADDILEPDFISKRVELLEKDTSLSYCTGEIVWINELDNPIEMPKKQYGIYENITRNVASFNPIVFNLPVCLFIQNGSGKA